MVATAIPVIAGGLYDGMKALYRIGSDVNAFMDSHIRDMKASDVPAVSRSGAVLESAKVGFGIGYVAPAVIIVSGQLLLGNPLNAVYMGTVALLPTNPVAMTCAAVGAVLWGWNALSKKEQEALLKTISEGLSVGIELIRSIIKFVVGTAKKLIGESNFQEMKKQIAAVRDQIKSAVKGLADSVGMGAGVAMDAASETLDTAIETTAAYWKKLKAVIIKDEPQGEASKAPL